MNSFANPVYIELDINGQEGISKSGIIFGGAGETYVYAAIVSTKYSLSSADIRFLYKSDDSYSATATISEDKRKIKITFSSQMWGTSIAIWKN